MKEIWVTWTYVDTILVPDDAIDTEIEVIAYQSAPATWVTDVEIGGEVEHE